MTKINHKGHLILIISFLTTTIFLSSCSIYYKVEYQTYLEGSPNESLQYRDSLVNVSFDPKPNGIYFNIENLKKNNLYLIWDKSYFIEPNGSSSKSLNIDVFETPSPIREKENYESVLPQGYRLKSFTCSSKDISIFSTYNSLTLYNQLTNSINIYSDYNEFYLLGKYWYLGEKVSYSSKSEIPKINENEVSLIQKYIKDNNNLSMGFTIRNKNNEFEYHFKFPIKKVVVLNRKGQNGFYTKIVELNKDNEFKSISLEGKKSIQQGNPITEGIIIKCTNCGKDFKVIGKTKGKIDCPYCGTQNTLN